MLKPALKVGSYGAETKDVAHVEKDDQEIVEEVERGENIAHGQTQEETGERAEGIAAFPKPQGLCGPVYGGWEAD